MTKPGDVLLTIVFTLFFGYYALLGMAFGVAPWLALLCLLGIGSVIFSFFQSSKWRYLLFRCLGLLLIQPLIISDHVRSYPSQNAGDLVINSLFNLPNLLLFALLVFSAFRKKDLSA
jgi:hypothetical protein